MDERPQTRLPRLSVWRRLGRFLLRGLAWLLIRLFTRPRVNGLEHFPRQGPALIVTNHLGGADAVLGMVFLPLPADALAKIGLYAQFPLLGWLMEWYGVIWVHPGQPDRQALRVALQALEQGRLVAIAPEGRESLTGALEEGTGGAAYLAIKADVPLVPVTYTCTEDWRVFGNMKRLRRTDVSLTVGPVFRLPTISDPTLTSKRRTLSPPSPGRRNARERGEWKEAIRQGTQTIMRHLARQLPPEYRGVYTAGLQPEASPESETAAGLRGPS
jgi:1-acyl-sn-glycerol-3-phosphate acyltransferase